jgi:large conductance mechanosensitive channel
MPTMSLASEFKEFAMKGSVLDLAVGVVIGAAFGKIVSSLVGDVIMPALSPVLGSVNFSELAVQIATNAAGKPVQLKYGSFLQTIFEFLIIALSIFVVIKGINRLKRPPAPAANAPPPPPTKTEALLQDIKDLLAKKQ